MAENAAVCQINDIGYIQISFITPVANRYQTYSTVANRYLTVAKRCVANRYITVCNFYLF